MKSSASSLIDQIKPSNDAEINKFKKPKDNNNNQKASIKSNTIEVESKNDVDEKRLKKMETELLKNIDNYYRAAEKEKK